MEASRRAGTEIITSSLVKYDGLVRGLCFFRLKLPHRLYVYARWSYSQQGILPESYTPFAKSNMKQLPRIVD